MKIGEVARLAGVTVRTLHYYDEIGLLRLSGTTEASYRLYNDDDLAVLQQILFFRELDFPLEDIRRILQDPQYDRTDALRRQRTLLLQKRARLDGLISLVDNTLKGESDMSFTQFDTTEIENTKKQYAAEVKARWGQTDACKEYAAKPDADTANAAFDALLDEFAQHRTLAPDSAAAQQLVAKLQAFITAHYYTCTDAILAELGQMYVADERFLKNIDRRGTGTAAFMAAAIAAHTA